MTIREMLKNGMGQTEEERTGIDIGRNERTKIMKEGQRRN